MKFIITFFRDILDGPLYIVVSIISVILICSCIGYLAETSLNKKKSRKEYEASHANLSTNQDMTQQIQSTTPQALSMNSSSDSNNIQTGAITNSVSIMETPQQSYSSAVSQNASKPIPELNQQSNSEQQNNNIPKSMGTLIDQPTVANTTQDVNH